MLALCQRGSTGKQLRVRKAERRPRAATRRGEKLLTCHGAQQGADTLLFKVHQQACSQAQEVQGGVEIWWDER